MYAASLIYRVFVEPAPFHRFKKFSIATKQVLSLLINFSGQHLGRKHVLHFFFPLYIRTRKEGEINENFSTNYKFRSRLHICRGKSQSQISRRWKAAVPGHPLATRNPRSRVSRARARMAYIRTYTYIYAYIYTHTYIRHGEVRCTPLDFPGFSQGCGRALNRVEGGRRV